MTIKLKSLKERSKMENVSLYSEARNEYLKQMSTWIVPPVVEFFRREYSIIATREGKKAMSAFQMYCADIPKWNQDVIETNIQIVLENCRCDYLEELMTAVFIAHTKMLTAIRVSSKQKKMKITLPKLDHFLHRFFIECARAFWKAPFLFSDEYSPIEKQKNVLQIEAMCIDALSGAVRSLLPVKSILTEYLDESDEDDSDEEMKPETKPESKPTHRAPVKEQTTSQMPSLVMSEVEEVEESNPTTSVVKVEKSSESAVSLAPTAVGLVVNEVSETENNDNKVSIMPTIFEKHSITKVEAPPSTPVAEQPTPSSEPSRLMIDTEPSVHFTPYDTVFDENTANIAEIRYTPKVSVEDKPPSMWGVSEYEDDVEEFDDIGEDLPRLNIGNTEGSELGLDDVEDFEAPPKPVETKEEDEDIDIPLADSNDFEELE
jgi:hypothetical protein